MKNQPLLWPEALIEAFWSQIDTSAGPNACWSCIDKLPFEAKRYSVFKFKHKLYLAHRLALAIRDNIPIPPRNIHAAHDCPGGDNKWCCNPKHLKWLTSKEHGKDMTAKGQGGHKAHPERAARGDASGRRLHPDSYKNQKGPHPELSPFRRGECAGSHKLSEDNVRQIRIALAYCTQAAIAKQYKVSGHCIWAIKERRTWSHVL